VNVSEETVMETQHFAVRDRHDELRRIGDELRWERHRRRRQPTLRALRLAVARRLIRAGVALLDRPAAPVMRTGTSSR
jgi:hypothetical protein